MCTVAALCRLIEVDCSIISLIKFSHFLLLSFLYSRQTTVAVPHPPSLSLRRPLALHPLLPPSLLIIVSITHPSSPSHVFLSPSLPLSSFLLVSHTKSHDTAHPAISLPSPSFLCELGKISGISLPAVPHFFRSYLHLISGFYRCSAITTLMWRYLSPVKCKAFFFFFCTI